MKEKILDILAERYASSQMCRIWSPAGRVIREREYWIAILKAQKKLGMEIPPGVIRAYERVKDEVNLDSILARERVTKHDVKARIEEFCSLAGHQHIHKGLTSRDLTENVEQMQVYHSLKLVREKSVAVLLGFTSVAEKYKEHILTGRTHNVAAQFTTLGKRVAMFGEEFMRALEGMDNFISTYPFRGLKGAVGTQLDQITLFDGDSGKVAELEGYVLDHLGVDKKWDNVGQIYPRSLDFETVSRLALLSSAPSNCARTFRLMAGHELITEGFAKGQVGSSSMPHKINSRSCERVTGFNAIIHGYLEMLSHLTGDQWNEGDVSCSVVRRVALPDSFFAMDGLLETFLTIISQMEVFPAVMDKENKHYLPFLMSTTILMEAVKAGAGRESAHEAIKKHSLDVISQLRSGQIEENDLLDRLVSDSQLKLDMEKLKMIFDESQNLAGNASRQVDMFIRKVDTWRKRFPNVADYTPDDLL